MSAIHPLRTFRLRSVAVILIVYIPSRMKVFRPELLLLFVAVAACEQPIQTSEKLPDPQREALRPRLPPTVGEPAQVDSLIGEWRVAAIDGRSVEESYALSMAGNDERLWWEPGCAGIARTYRIEGQRITFAPIRSPAVVGSPPRPVCPIGPPPRLRDVVRALDSAVSVARTPTNGVLISGPSHSVTLFSQ